MDKTHAYRPMLSMGFIMAACSCFLLTVQVGPDNATMIAIRFVSTMIAISFTLLPNSNTTMIATMIAIRFVSCSFDLLLNSNSR